MDIVLPYVDCSDPAWQDTFLAQRWKKPLSPHLREVFLRPYKCRFSDHGLFRYWWRALERNYRDVGRVHLLLMSESQYPSFLRRDDPRIVPYFHREFIPEHLNPCYNSSVIELCAIKELDLPETFILANDDMYFNAPVDDTRFVDSGRPLTRISVGPKYGTGSNFQCTLANGRDLVSRHYGKPCPDYRYYHLFQVYDTAFCKMFLASEWEAISAGMTKSRNRKNHNHMMLMMAQNLAGVSEDSDRFPCSGYYEMPNIREEDFGEIGEHPCICLNDTNGMHVGVARKYLEERYPEPCGFEIRT